MPVQTRRRAFTDRSVAALRRKAKRYVVADPGMIGHFLRVPPKGPVVFVCTARDGYHKQHWTTIGHADHMTIETARAAARAAIARMKAGLPGIEPPKPAPDSVEAVCRNWLTRVVEKNGYLTGRNHQRIVEKYILVHPPFRGRAFTSIKRSEVAVLLDHVEDAHGVHMATKVQNVIRTVSKWYAERDDDYEVLFLGKSRASGRKSRSRTLTDEEIRRIWLAAEDADCFGALIQLLLLTGQRLSVVLDMRWRDIAGDTWTIPRTSREKGNIGSVRLPPAALAIIRAQPRMLNGEFVLLYRHNLGRAKAAFDKVTGITGWRLHDLRRTARSLLSRPGLDVSSHIAELVLGHAIKGVARIYDRHQYLAEKSDALLALSREIDRIVETPESASNVLPLAAVS
jgi:integrase